MADDGVYARPAVMELADGTIAYRASSFGYCLGALVRARLGMTPSAPPDLMLERFAEGSEWESRVLAAGLGVDWHAETKESVLQRHGEVDPTSGQVATQLSWGNKVVTCHPDAIVQHGASKQYRVCEVKFLAQEGANKIVSAVAKDGMLGLGPGYAWQGSIEMLTTGLPMLYLLGVKGRTADGLTLETVIPYEFDEPCYSLRDVKMRVATVEGYVARGEMPPCVVPFDYPCGYWAEHDAPEKVTLDDEVLVHLTESYTRNQAKKQAVLTEESEIRKDIALRLDKVGADGGVCGDWQIARTPARPGNVSWSKWAEAVKKKYPKVQLDAEQFRGAETAAGIRMTKNKTEGVADG